MQRANRFAIAGLACAALAMAGSLMFVAEVLFGSVVAAAAGGIAATGCAWFWYPHRRTAAPPHRRARPVGPARRAG